LQAFSCAAAQNGAVNDALTSNSTRQAVSGGASMSLVEAEMFESRGVLVVQRQAMGGVELTSICPRRSAGDGKHTLSKRCLVTDFPFNLSELRFCWARLITRRFPQTGMTVVVRP
jgi:hypothetical protein